MWTSLFLIWLAVSQLADGSNTGAMVLAAAVLLDITIKAIGGRHEKI